MTKIFNLIFALSLSVLALPVLAAPPQLPQLIYGQVSINGSPAPAGTVIIATVNGIEKGRITTTVAGQYGGTGAYDEKLMVQGDIIPGAAITFTSGGVSAPETYTFESGEIGTVNLSFDIPVPAAPSSGGGGGGGGGGGFSYAPPGPSGPTTITLPTAPQVSPQTPGGVIALQPLTGGQVLGAVTFRFNQDISQGRSGDDVLELQKKLTIEGVYKGPQTGYFGPLTLAAVKEYQKRKGLPTTGFVGPMTRGEFNKAVGGEVAGISVSRSQLIADLTEKISAIQAQIQVLVAELNKMLKAQVSSSVPSPSPSPTPTQNPVLTTINISPSSMGIIVGEARTLTARALDQFGNVIAAPITWSSSDPTVAAINAANGQLTGLSGGVAYITAASGSTNGTATITVQTAGGGGGGGGGGGY